MTEEVINTAYLETRLGVFDDSQEISDMLSDVWTVTSHTRGPRILMGCTF
jgi:hypothetical protein